MSPASETKKQKYWRPENDQVSDKDKLLAKIKKDPFIPIGKILCKLNKNHNYIFYY